MDETLDQVNYEDSVYFNNFEKNGEGKGGNYLEMKNIFLYIKRKVKISSKTGRGISDDGLT